MSKTLETVGSGVAIAIGVIIGLIVADFTLALAAPKPPVPPDVIDWQCRATAKIQVCELQLGDGTRCVVTDKGGVDCEWRGR